MRRRFSQVELDWIARSYQAGLTTYGIAGALKVHQPDIVDALHHIGVPMRKRGRRKDVPTPGIRFTPSPRPTPTRWRCACGQIHHVDDTARCAAPWEEIDRRLASECRKMAGAVVVALSVLAAPLAAQFQGTADGQSYPVRGGPLVHAAAKAVVSGAVDAGLRSVGVTPRLAWWVSTVGVFGAAKGVELAKGHKLGPWDTLHDAAWHVAGVELVRKRPGRLAVSLGVAVVLGHKASPRWR